MKRFTYITVILIGLLVGTPAKAQFSWGIKGGVNLGNKDLTVLANKEAAFDLTNYTGFFIGPKIEVRIPVLGFGIEAATLYAQQDMKLSESDMFRQNSIQIPLNIKYSFGLGNSANIFIAAGPEFDFNVGQTETVISTLTYTKEGKPQSGAIKAYVIDEYILSLNAGLGFTLFNHLQVSLNYNMPWGKSGDYIYISAEEIENAENIGNGEKITYDAVKTLLGTKDKFNNALQNIKSGTIQISAAYLF